jgi:hypothetical protein
MRQEAVEALKAVPPTGYIAGVVMGLDWGTIASILACVYTGWLLAEKVWKLLAPRYKAWRAKRGL